MMQALPRITLCLLICGLAPIGGWSAETCHSVSLTAELFAGQGFERMIGGDLVFRFHPEKLGHDGQLDGWSVALSPKSSPRQDYIYPVNPPIRFNGLQTLGVGYGYGEDSRASLEYAHKMRFLLNQKDYDRIQPMLTAALWPYNAPHPETAGADYLGALKDLRTGMVELTVLSYELARGTDSIRRIKFRVTVTAPMSFKFASGLRSKLSSCLAMD